MADVVAALLSTLREITPLPIKQVYWAAWGLYASPWFWLPLAALLLAERRWPAVPAQRTLSAGFLEDAAWLNIGVIFKVFAAPAVVGSAIWAWETLTHSYRLPVLSALPVALRAVLALVLFDALRFALHWVHHKVPALWHVHAIHHAQEELNPLTGSRHHALEYVTAQGLALLPMLLLGLTSSAMLLSSAALTFIARLQHANLAWDFGPLGAVLVSPHYHRIHHSRDRQYHDCNYGELLTIWDRMCGTFHRDQGVYPATGLDGVQWRTPAGRTPRALAHRLLEQLWYPVRRIALGGWRSRG